MGIARRFLTTALAVMIASCMGATAAFADASEVSGVSLALSADKAGYASGDAAEFAWTLENGTDKPLADVQMKLSLPAGMIAADGAELEFSADDVAAGDSAQGTVKALVPDTPLSTALSTTGDPLSDIPVGAILAALAALACLIVVAARKGDVFRGPLCALLALALVAGMCPATALAEPAHADEQKRVSLSAKQVVTVNGTEATATLDATFGATIEGKQVSFYLTYDEYVKNPGDFKAYWVADGALLEQPATPLSYIGEFGGWYADLECTQPFDFTAPVTEDVVLVAKWAIDETDSDNDGLADGVEDYLGTDPARADTDGDGLPDGVEIAVATDPLDVDTDEDGVGDFDEDFDEDGLSNGRELALSVDPANPDTDSDDLGDGREADDLGTDPTNVDTDGDEAEDGWEVYYGFDPLTFNASFAAEVGVKEASADAPVVASVKMNVSGHQLSTLGVKRESPLDNPLVSTAIPGYMGSAYDFTVEGSFDEATITFTFDEATFGTPDEDFKPAIFYVNEETGTLDKLPNQTITGNEVSATTTHFSTYILLNEVPFNKAWEAEIKPPLENGDSGNNALDIVFAVDYSVSLRTTDPEGLRKLVTRQFIEKLRSDVDKAALVKFATNASVVCDLTSDFESLIEAVNQLGDNGNWTNGRTGLDKSLTILEQSTAKNRYILFLTDGMDTRNFGPSYETLIERAQESGVKIYTVGLGRNVDSATLEKIADETGGKYYQALAGLDLDEIYAEIEGETIDLTTDSNDDGLPDYYNDLIREGTLVLSNGSRELAGIDFNYDCNGNPSSDYDGDGTKNGDEIKLVTTAAGGVYLQKVSDPRFSMSTPSNPDGLRLTSAYDQTRTNALLDDSDYAYTERADYLVDNWVSMVDPAISLVFGTNKNEAFRSTLMDYIEEYSSDMERVTDCAQRNAVIETLLGMAGDIQKNSPVWGEDAEKARETLGTINSLIEEIAKGVSITYVKTEFTKIIYEYWEILPNGVVYGYLESISAMAVKVDVSGVIESSADKLGHFFDLVEMGSVAVKSADELLGCASINANNQAFANSVDVLAKLKSSASSSEMRSAAAYLYDAMLGEYGGLIKSVFVDGAVNLVGVGLAILAGVNPYAKAVVIIRDLVDGAFGIGDHYRHKFQMIGYGDLTDAYASLFKGCVTSRGSAYVPLAGKEYSALNYLTDVAQLRILGEKEYVAYEKMDGLAGWIASKAGAHEDIDAWLSGRIGYVSETAGTLGLTVNL